VTRKALSAEAEQIRRFNRAALEGRAPALVWPLYHALRAFTGDGDRPFIGKNAKLLDFMGFENNPAMLRRLRRSLAWLEENGWIERWNKPEGRAGSHRLLVLTEPGYEVLTQRAKAALDATDWYELTYELFNKNDGKMSDDWLAIIEDLAPA